MTIGRGVTCGHLSNEEVRDYTVAALSNVAPRGRRVLVIIPDLTRNAPVPFFFRILTEVLRPQVKALDFLLALGTHPPLTMEKIAQRVGLTPDELAANYPDIRFFNHAYDEPGELAIIGTISEAEVYEISAGLLKENAVVTVNKRIFGYDLLIVLSPVVPHEVAGFSGGNKYFFPGIAGADFIHFFHWLSAVITNMALNGVKENPVRRLLDRAASFLPIPRLFINLVMREGDVAGVFIGEDRDAWSQAADLSAKVHVRYMDRAYERVLGIAPPYYEDLWVAGKVMYKLEPIVADGGELVIYAPHITEISYTHGATLKRIGYHVRDYYLAQMDKFRDVPRGILAHSTHVKGAGTYEAGTERPRINVVLATDIPEQTCKQINLGYLDYRSINLGDWRNREQEGVLLVERAGERLYRLRPRE
ncbi:MAG: lactate racemase domain-containing protein [candidate division KSB1 bacterium]|nr:lactate racemase domain-containing protein [candidate division KSB1 bacterium]